LKTESYILPQHWACFLFNDDYSGYIDEDLKEIEDFCKGLGPCIDMTDENEFSWTNNANNLGGAVATFHFQVLE